MRGTARWMPVCRRGLRISLAEMQRERIERSRCWRYLPECYQLRSSTRCRESSPHRAAIRSSARSSKAITRNGVKYSGMVAVLSLSPDLEKEVERTGQEVVL